MAGPGPARHSHEAHWFPSLFKGTTDGGTLGCGAPRSSSSSPWSPPSRSTQELSVLPTLRPGQPVPDPQVGTCSAQVGTLAALHLRGALRVPLCTSVSVWSSVDRCPMLLPKGGLLMWQVPPLLPPTRTLCSAGGFLVGEVCC